MQMNLELEEVEVEMDKKQMKLKNQIILPVRLPTPSIRRCLMTNTHMILMLTDSLLT